MRRKKGHRPTRRQERLAELGRIDAAARCALCKVPLGPDPFTLDALTGKRFCSVEHLEIAGRLTEGAAR